MATRRTYEEAIRVYVEASGDKELGALAAQLGKLGDGSDHAAEQAQQLLGELEKLARVSANIRSFTTLKATLAETGDELAKAKLKLAGLGAEFDRAETPSKKLEAALARASKEVETLTKAQNRQQAELSRTTNALKVAGVDTDKLGEAYAELQDEMGGFARRAGTAADAMARTGKATKDTAAGMSGLDRAAHASSKSLAAIATKLTLVSGAATAAISGLAALTGASLFTGAIRSATTLEDALSQVRAVSGATAEEMVQLKEAAEAGGAATRFSTLEAAQGLGELARATGSATTAIAALPSTLALAQAAGIGVADAATLMTTTLTQFGLGADQATRVADVLAKEVNSTTDSMTGLGLALTYAAPLAKQLGLDVEDTAAIIGVLADEGFRGERAGTALRNVFSEMSDPASKFSQALRDLGIESTDFATVIEQLAAKGAEGREALLELDAAARPAITALVDKGSAKLAVLEASLRGASGEAERTARIMGDNLAGSVESIKDSFDRTRRSLVEPLLAPLATELQGLAGELEAFAASPDFAEIKVALKTMFVEGATAARELIENVDFAELAANIKQYVGEAGTTIDALKENLGSIVNTVQVVGNAFQLTFNTIQSVILGFAALISKLVSELAKLTDGMSGPARALLEFVGAIDEGEGSLARFADGMGAVADEFRDRFATNVGEAAEAARALADNATEAGVSAEAGMGQVAAAAAQAETANTNLAAAAESAKVALEGQAQGAADAAAGTAQAAGQIESSAERLKKAFSDMGIASQRDLSRAAESARKNFDLIRDAVSAGEATAEDARRAFVAYAAAARAAVADSDVNARARVEAELAVKAAVLDTTGALNLMGESGARAGSEIEGGAHRAAGALGGLSSAASAAAANTARVGEESWAAGKQAEQAAGGVQTMTHAFTAMSDAAYAAIRAQNKYANNSEVWARSVSAVGEEWRRQSEQIEKANAALDAQLAKFDPLAAKVESLQLQYEYVNEAQLRQLAEKQQRLEQEQARLQQERKQAQEELSRANQDAQATSAQPAGPARAAGGAAAVGGAPIVIRLETGGGSSGGPGLSRADLDRLAQEITALVLRELGTSASVSMRRF